MSPMIRAAMAQLRALRRKQWLSLFMLAAAVVCALGLLSLLLSTTLDKGTAAWGKVGLLAVGVLAAAAAIVTAFADKGDFGGEPAAEGAPRPRFALLTPGNAGIVLIAIFTAFGAMTDTLSQLEPRAASESNAFEIENTVKETRNMVEALNPGAPPIYKTIVGRWGEQDPDCALVWEIRVAGEALSAEIVKQPGGVAPFKLIAHITGAKGNQLDIVGESPQSANGQAATFTLESDGMTRRLVWDDRARPSDRLELIPCG